MSLLDNIPKELSLLIEQYKHPINCFICKKKTFTIRICYCSPKTKCCNDCLLKCNNCDCYVSKNNIIAWDSSLMTFEKNSNISRIKIDMKCFIFSDNYYSSHYKCDYCEELFCFKCSIRSIKVCPS